MDDLSPPARAVDGMLPEADLTTPVNVPPADLTTPVNVTTTHPSQPKPLIVPLEQLEREMMLLEITNLRRERDEARAGLSKVKQCPISADAVRRRRCMRGAD